MLTTKSLIYISLIFTFAMALQDGDEIAFKTHASHNTQYQFLNAGTVDGSVGMAKDTDYNSASGTWWKVHHLSDGSWAFESLGNIPNDQHIYLNVDIETGEVNLAASTDSASGTHWNLVLLSDGTVALQNMGSHSNPTFVYLNADTYTGTVNLAVNTDSSSASGTHWEIVLLPPDADRALAGTWGGYDDYGGYGAPGWGAVPVWGGSGGGSGIYYSGNGEAFTIGGGS